MRRNSQPQGVHDGVEKDFNTGDEKAENEIVLDHLDVGGRGKPVAHLTISFRCRSYQLWLIPASSKHLWIFSVPYVKEKHLDKQCGLNQHSCKVDCHNGLEEKGLEISDKFEKDDDDDDGHDDDDDDDGNDDIALKWLVA